MKKLVKIIIQFCKRLCVSAKCMWNSHVKGIRLQGSPIFIVGCGHSGTSLLLAVLSAHSRIYAIPYESGVFNKSSIKERKHALKHFDVATIAAGKHRWVEKTPTHIRAIDKMLECIPHAKVLVMMRDGRDVSASIKARVGDAEVGIRRWIKDNKMASKYFHNSNVKLVKYEDLIVSFDATARSILSFVGEDYEESIKNYHMAPRRWYSKKITKPESEASKDHNRLRNWQINQPIFDGRGRRKELSEAEMKMIMDIADEELAKYGYEA